MAKKYAYWLHFGSQKTGARKVVDSACTGLQGWYAIPTFSPSLSPLSLYLYVSLFICLSLPLFVYLGALSFLTFPIWYVTFFYVCALLQNLQPIFTTHLIVLLWPHVCMFLLFSVSLGQEETEWQCNEPKVRF